MSHIAMADPALTRALGVLLVAFLVSCILILLSAHFASKGNDDAND